MTIIAEIGQNHMGDMALAKQLIVLAKQCGADLAKLQLYDTDSIYPADSPVRQQAKEAELSFYQALMLFEYGARVGIEVFFSVFDVERVKWCEEIGVKRYKIACTMRDKSTMEAVAATMKPVIMSANFQLGYGGGDHCGSSKAMVDYLYCVPSYPTPLDKLTADFSDDYDGFSDHTIGLDTAKIVLARGAEIIEKHFAVDHLTGVDALWSMTPDELVELKRWEGICNQIL